MNIRLIVALSMLAGAAVGASAIQALHAQTKSPVYVVGEIDDTKAPAADAKEYGRKMNALIESHGGHFIAKGGIAGLKVTALDGTAPKRVVIIAWDNMGQIQAWRADPKFKLTRQIVGKHSKFRVYAVEGVR
jgi:uncharacterized protein (DUF1330 family)